MDASKPQLNKLYVYEGASPMFKKVSQKMLGQVSYYGEGDIIRYAQNKTVGGVERVFLMITLESDIKKVAKFFKTAHKALKSDSHLEDQVLFVKSRSKPMPLSITFGGK